MAIIDLKSHPFLRKVFGKTLWGAPDVYRTIDFQTGYGLYLTASLSPLCRKIQGRFQCKNVLLSRSVSMHGICPNYTTGKPARYRDLLTISKQKTVPYGHPWKSFKVNSCRSKRKTRLAHICRTSPKSNRHCQRPIQRRLISRRSRRDSICSGCNHYRSLSVSISLGTISKEKSCCQTPYTLGPKGQHSHIHPHFRWQTTRCQRSRSFKAGSRCILRNGSRLSGLREAIHFQPDSSIFRYPSQSKHAIQKTLLKSCRQDDRASMRSDNHTYRLLYKQALPRYSTSSEVPRCRIWKDIRISHQQFHFTSINNSPTVSKPMAGRTVFQMDKATPENKEILWYFRECSQDSSLDSSLCLYPRSDNEKASQPPRESLHNFTNFERISFREDRTLSIGYGKEL